MERKRQPVLPRPSLQQKDPERQLFLGIQRAIDPLREIALVLRFTTRTRHVMHFKDLPIDVVSVLAIVSEELPAQARPQGRVSTHRREESIVQSGGINFSLDG